MKSYINFDTLEYVEQLKRAGMQPEQAEAVTRATAHAFNQMIDNKDLTTRADLHSLKADLQSFIIKTVTTAVFLLGGLQTLFHYTS